MDLILSSAELASKRIAEIAGTPLRPPLISSLKNDEAVEINKILEFPKAIVLGHPGAGKTTIGKYIAYFIAQGNTSSIGEHLKNYIPIIIREDN